MSKSPFEGEPFDEDENRWFREFKHNWEKADGVVLTKFQMRVVQWFSNAAVGIIALFGAAFATGEFLDLLDAYKEFANGD